MYSMDFPFFVPLNLNYPVISNSTVDDDDDGDNNTMRNEQKGLERYTRIRVPHRVSQCFIVKNVNYFAVYTFSM